MPTKLTNFKTLFEPKILNRGMDYFKNGDVLSLRNDYDNHWTAIVKGNERYQVEIALSQDGWGDILIDDMSCTCDYWDNCKHLVAVLMKLQTQVEKGDLKTISCENERTFTEQLGSFDKAKLIEFIDYINKKHPSIEQDWTIWASGQQSQLSANQTKNTHYPSDNQISKTIQQRINQLLTLEEYNEWEEFYFDEQLQGLENLLNEFASQPTYQLEIALTWIDVALATYEEIFDEINDSIATCLTIVGNYLFKVDDYQISWQVDFVAYDCHAEQTLIHKISILADAWRETTARDRYTVSSEIERFWFDFLWGLGQQQPALDWLDSLIAQAEKLGNYDKADLLAFKIQVLDYLNLDSQDFIENNLDLPKIRQLKIDNLLKNKQFDLAIALLKEGILDTNKELAKAEWYAQLVTIGEQIEDTALIREYSYLLAFMGWQIDKDYCLRWQQTFNQSEWLNAREQAQQQLIKAKKWTLLTKFYQLENQTDELVNLLKQLQDKYLIDSYAKTIGNVDMTWLIDFYRNYWNNKIDGLSSRKHYQALVNEVMQTMDKFPEGKTAWLQTVADWRIKFSQKPRRPALVEELAKIH